MIMLGEKKKQAVSQILGPAESELDIHEKDDGGAGESSLHHCIHELIDAIHDKNLDGAVAAFKACFAHCESEPHEEGPHIEGY